MEKRERIGFVGLGRMGYPMARNIAQGGYNLVVYDARPDAVARLAAETGAEPAADIAGLASCTVVLTMLPTSGDVEQVLLGNGAGGLLSLLAGGSLIVDCSTGDPVVTRRLGTAAAAAGLRMVDAPVAGGMIFAQDGSLDILTGGGTADVVRAQAILRCVGKRFHNCGALGAAHAMKLLNNFINAQALLAYAEAMSVGARFGIDLGVMIDSLRETTTGRNHPFEKKMLRQVMTGAFASGMAIGLTRKDVGLSLSLAENTGAWAPIMQQTSALWQQAVEAAGAHADQSEVVRLWEELNGVELRVGPDPQPGS
jgi:3-hydroxyisobutyrate dehydrogenase